MSVDASVAIGLKYTESGGWVPISTFQRPVFNYVPLSTNLNRTIDVTVSVNPDLIVTFAGVFSGSLGIVPTLGVTFNETNLPGSETEFCYPYSRYQLWYSLVLTETLEPISILGYEFDFGGVLPYEISQELRPKTLLSCPLCTGCVITPTKPVHAIPYLPENIKVVTTAEYASGLSCDGGCSSYTQIRYCTSTEQTNCTEWGSSNTVSGSYPVFGFSVMGSYPVVYIAMFTNGALKLSTWQLTSELGNKSASRWHYTEDTVTLYYTMQKIVRPVIGDYTLVDSYGYSQRYLQIDFTGEEPYDYLLVRPSSYTLYSDEPGCLPDPIHYNEIDTWASFETKTDPYSIIFEQRFYFGSHGWFFTAPLYQIYWYNNTPAQFNSEKDLWTTLSVDASDFDILLHCYGNGNPDFHIDYYSDYYTFQQEGPMEIVIIPGDPDYPYPVIDILATDDDLLSCKCYAGPYMFMSQTGYYYTLSETPAQYVEILLPPGFPDMYIFVLQLELVEICAVKYTGLEIPYGVDGCAWSGVFLASSF